MMNVVRDALERLLGGQSLSQAQAYGVMQALATSDEVPDALAGALLASMRAKGEVAEEVRGFARALRDLATPPTLPSRPAAPLVDMCGTGGDGSGSLNLSTGAALLAASCGAAVVKHGNRAVSSRSGSADVLGALGMPPDSSEALQMAGLSAAGFAFLFAPWYHPAIRSVASIRRALGVRTVFNLMGPLVNPARPPFQVVGAFSLEAARLMAHTLSGIEEVERAFVVHGAEGWDEATPMGPFTLLDVSPGSVAETTRDPLEVYDLPRCAPADLAGGDAAHNAAAIEAVFDGESGPHRDTLVLGAALTLEVCGLAPDPEVGRREAEFAIDQGRARATLDTLKKVHRGG